jgi:hypothetical protein
MGRIGVRIHRSSWDNGREITAWANVWGIAGTVLVDRVQAQTQATLPVHALRLQIDLSDLPDHLAI